MGPERDEDQIFPKAKFANVKIAAKKTIQKYFAEPVHYIFYGTLTIIIVGLFFGLIFSWQLYTILIILCVVNTYNYYARR